MTEHGYNKATSPSVGVLYAVYRMSTCILVYYSCCNGRGSLCYIPESTVFCCFSLQNNSLPCWPVIPSMPSSSAITNNTLQLPTAPLLPLLSTATNSICHSRSAIRTPTPLQLWIWMNRV